MIEHVHLGHGPAAYRWAGARTIAAVCDGCGAVTDIPAEELDALAERLDQGYGLRLSLGHSRSRSAVPTAAEPFDVHDVPGTR